MISVAVSSWTERVLDRGTLATPEDEWKIDAYGEYRARVCNRTIPASLARAASCAEKCYIPLFRGTALMNSRRTCGNSSTLLVHPPMSAPA